jgi:CubicO group peptidase (beta-lactamase class C family)
VERFAARIVSVLCVALLAVSCASVPPETPATVPAGRFDAVRAEMTSLIRKGMRANKVTNLAIALVDGQDTVWEQGFGYANLQARTPVTPDTAFCVGSVAKLFTATAIMQLVEQGKIDLDAPLVDSLPEYSVRTRFPEAGPITIRDILTHHSGLPCDFWVQDCRPSLGRDRWFSQTLQLLKDAYVANPPGFIHSYSNVGFCVLGSVIEKASGMSYEQYMQEQILAPLGMRNAAYTSSSLDQESMAMAYVGGKPDTRLAIDGDPAGGLWGSVRDMASFMKMALADGITPSGRFLRAGTMAEMLRPQNAETPMDLDFRMGLGWELDEIAGSLTAEHGGDARFYHSYLRILPEEKLGVFAISGSHESMSLVRTLATTTLKRALEVKTGKVEQAPAAAAKETVALSAEDLESVPGFYATESGLIQVIARNGNLWFRLGGNELKLVPRPERQFSLQFLLFGFIPFMLPGLDSAPWFGFLTVQDRTFVVANASGTRRIIGEEINPVAIPEAWIARLGKWVPVDTEGPNDVPLYLTLRKEAGLLMLDVMIGGGTAFVWALSPLGDGEAVVAGIGRYMGETIWAKTSGGEEHLVYTGYELRKSTD